MRTDFDGGAISTEAGGLLLREVEKRTGIIAQFAACFRDYRDPVRVEHRVKEWVAQRVYGRAFPSCAHRFSMDDLSRPTVSGRPEGAPGTLLAFRVVNPFLTSS